MSLCLVLCYKCFSFIQTGHCSKISTQEVKMCVLLHELAIAWLLLRKVATLETENRTFLCAGDHEEQFCKSTKTLENSSSVSFPIDADVCLRRSLFDLEHINHQEAFFVYLSSTPRLVFFFISSGACRAMSLISPLSSRVGGICARNSVLRSQNFCSKPQFPNRLRTLADVSFKVGLKAGMYLE